MMNSLLTQCTCGGLRLSHRVVMSAMTRLRNDPVTEAPRELNALYYAQRASPGALIISEGTAPSHHGRGYIRAPGLYSAAHIDGWKLVTQAVHEKGAFIFCQIMSTGRVSHSSLLPEGNLPVAPSSVKMEGVIRIPGGKVPYETPRALKMEEIPSLVDQFGTAAKRAIEAGFNGIEIHAGNGYIIQQFLALKTNLRSDEYGGSVENRARFLLEVVDGCVSAIGADKVGIKLQPGVTFSDLIEPEDDCFAQLAYLGPALEKRKLAYVCLSSCDYDPYYKFVGLEKPNFEKDVFKFFREQYKGTLMINGGISPEKDCSSGACERNWSSYSLIHTKIRNQLKTTQLEKLVYCRANLRLLRKLRTLAGPMQGSEYVADGTTDMVAFAIPYIANANLPDLIGSGQELNQGGWDTEIWYGSDPANDEKGYTDWPLVKVAST